MILQNSKNQIVAIWDRYIAENKPNLDLKGVPYDDIDAKRLEAIETLKIIVQDFVTGAIDLAEFKTDIDSFNKKNNYWGFTSIKGQMFFNLLATSAATEDKMETLTELLKLCISEPHNLSDALLKIKLLNDYVLPIFSAAPDKRKAPNPGSIGYFLSYFWQIHNNTIWPILYSSMIESFKIINIWPFPISQQAAYETFFQLNEEIKSILSLHAGRNINNWETEHSFWNFNNVTAYPKPVNKVQPNVTPTIFSLTEPEEPVSALKTASFNIHDYVPRISWNLIELGNETELSGAAKGSKYEKAVLEVFKHLGFIVQHLGQGTGREPDLIATHREENVAFIIDAKAYSNGYMMSTYDERAIKEYIAHHCPRLQREGIKKIGFLIVSNAFKSDFLAFINDMTWNTEIKRFSLISSDALLHLIAYKMKDQLPLQDIVDALVNIGSTITAQDIIEKFDDI